MNIIISSDKNPIINRNINEIATYEINVSMSITGPGSKSYTIEMGKAGTYYFCFCNINLSRTSMVYILNEKGMVCDIFSGKKLIGVDPYRELKSIAVNGEKFTIRISNEDKTTSTLRIKSTNRIDTPLLKVNEGVFDEYGRISYSDLKLYDSEASSLLPPVGRVTTLSGHGTGWLLGKTSYFITNAHVIQPAITDIGPSATIIFLLRDNDDYSGVSISAEEIIIMGTEDVETDHNNDYALVSMNPFDVENSRIQDLVGGLALNTDDEGNYIGSVVFMPGYPGYVQELLISYQKNNDTESRATLLEIKEEQLKYDCYSAPGSSGSPVISNDNKNVLGIDWGYDDPDPDYIFSGVRSSHIWSGISGTVSSDDNVNMQGLSLQKNVMSVGYVIQPDGEWVDFIPFDGSVYFREFSGKLQHLENYSSVTAKAYFFNLENISELTIRVAQSTSDGVFNLAENHGSENEQKKIIVRCLQEDNTVDLTEHNYLWIGLESIDSTSGEVVYYYIFQVSIQV